MENRSTQDADQLKYKVHSQTSRFLEFKDKYHDFMIEHEEDFTNLSLEMHDFYESQKQTKEEFTKKLDFCDDLKAAIKRHCPTWTFDIVPTGSTLTGLGMKNSDLDATIHLPKAAPKFTTNGVLDKRRASISILQIVRRICLNDEEMKTRIKPNVQLVPAQIPILKMETQPENGENGENGIEVDLGVIVELFLSSLHNTFLTKHYVDMDTRFAPFCAIVKIWGEKTGVKNPKDGGFNSYALVLLVTHFLQCGTFPPILANLPVVYKEQKFFALSDTVFPYLVDFSKPLPAPLPEITRNIKNVAELFLQFLHYYSNFDFRTQYISISGATLGDRASTWVQSQKNKDVYIEDPFDEHNPGRTVRNLPQIQKLFRETARKFEPHGDETWHFPTLNDIFSKFEENSTNSNSDEDDVTQDMDNLDVDSELEEF